MKQEGFDIEKIEDPVYILLPGTKKYVPLSKIIYEDIGKGEYRF
jgi:hypothetical protein